MEKNSDLNISPNKLRVNYTLGSKSSKLVNINKKTKIKTAETTKDSLTYRTSVTPIRESSKNTSCLLAKLQEELDSEEISIQISKFKELPEGKRLESECLVYEQYLENLIAVVFKSDLGLGNSLLRGWKGYKGCMRKKIERFGSGGIRKIVLDLRDKGCQVSEEMLMRSNEQEIERYIGSLHRVIKGMGQMQMDKIIGKLTELSFNMRPIDLPELSEAGEVNEIDFTDTIKSIYTKLKTRTRQTENLQNESIKKAKSAFTQTYLSLEDFRTGEVYKVLLLEKEKKIESLELKQKRLEEIEELLRSKSKECEELRKKYIDIKVSSCSQCKNKRELLENSNSQMRNLKISIEKGFSVEKELEIVKAKLVESNQVITNNAKTIIDLTQSLDHLSIKLQENLLSKKQLEDQIKVSEKGVTESMLKLEQSEKKRAEVELKLINELALISTLKNKLKNVSNENSQLRKEKARTTTQKFSNINNKTEDTRTRGRLHTTTNQIESEEPASSSHSPEKKRLLIRNEYSQMPSKIFEESEEPKNEAFAVPEVHEVPINHSPTDQKLNQIKVNKIISKKKTIIQWLSITKQEYLMLSKKARLELFECLYEHKERCGAECEHLKRAMLIRARDKGLIFPTKKYNIS